MYWDGGEVGGNRSVSECACVEFHHHPEASKQPLLALSLVTAACMHFFTVFSNYTRNSSAHLAQMAQDSILWLTPCSWVL